MTLMQQQWEEFAKATFGNNLIGPYQYIAIKRAFYSGAIMIITELSKMTETMPEDDATAKLQEVVIEILAEIERLCKPPATAPDPGPPPHAE